jgi:hypothetical protein
MKLINKHGSWWLNKQEATRNGMVLELEYIEQEHQELGFEAKKLEARSNCKIMLR